MVWLREAAGWVLLGTGLAAFAVCYFVFLLPGRILEAGVLLLIGLSVFRAGSHMLSVAMAAKASRELDRQPEVAAPAARPLAMPALVAGKPTASVVPGRAR